MSMNASFWDVEDTDAASVRVRDMTVTRVHPREVNEFCRRYHYAGHGGAATWCWGMWHGPVLMGVVAYNNGTATSTAGVFGEDYKQHVWHMGRLALAEESPHNSESRLIGLSLRSIAAEHPDVWAVLTFAATDVGHIGYVYQATNALYTGTGGEPTYYTTADGVRMTHRPGKGTITPAAAAARGWTKHTGTPKHRYVYILGNKTERRQRRALLCYPVLPYPKAPAVSEAAGIRSPIPTG